jgi:hypothetical protein
MPGATMPYQTRVMAPNKGRVFVFDFSDWPELLDEDADGTPVTAATIVSAVVTGPGGTPLAGVTAGTPCVLEADAVVDSRGTVVPAGKGVCCPIFSPSAAGDDVVVECCATLDDGSTIEIQGVIAIRNARP